MIKRMGRWLVAVVLLAGQAEAQWSNAPSGGSTTIGPPVDTSASLRAAISNETTARVSADAALSNLIVSVGGVTNGAWNQQINAVSNYAGQALTTGGMAYALASNAYTVASRAATGTPLYVEAGTGSVGVALNAGVTNKPAGTVWGTYPNINIGTNDTAGGAGTLDGVSPITSAVFEVLADDGNAPWQFQSYSDQSQWGFTNDQVLAITYNMVWTNTGWAERTLTNRVGAGIFLEPYYEYTNGTGIIRQAEFHIGFVHTNVSPNNVMGSAAASRLFQMNWIWPGSSGYPNGGREISLQSDVLTLSNYTSLGLAQMYGTRFLEPVRGYVQAQADTGPTNMLASLVGVLDSTPWGGSVNTNIALQMFGGTNGGYYNFRFKAYGVDGQMSERARIDGNGMSVSGTLAVAKTISGDGSGLTNLPAPRALAPYIADGTTWSNTWTIPSGNWASIRLVGCLSQNPAAGATNAYNVVFRINGDTGNNYARHWSRWTDGSAGAPGMSLSNNLGVAAAIYDSPINVSYIDVNIACPVGPSYKSFDVRSTAWGGNKSDRFDQPGMWRSTNAITTISIFHASTSNFQSGTIQPYLYPAGVTP